MSLSSVRYGTRLGDLKNKQSTHTRCIIIFFQICLFFSSQICRSDERQERTSRWKSCCVRAASLPAVAVALWRDLNNFRLSIPYSDGSVQRCGTEPRGRDRRSTGAKILHTIAACVGRSCLKHLALSCVLHAVLSTPGGFVFHDDVCELDDVCWPAQYTTTVL